MKIETKFNLDDIVIPVTIIAKYKTKKCERCNGKGVKCSCPNPECYDGIVTFNNIHPWIINKEYKSRIGKIRIDCLKNKKEIRYMLETTGIVFGVLWEEEDLFLTTEEAEKECELRNKELEQ